MKTKLLSLLALLGSAFAAEQITILGINDMHADIDNLPQLATFLKEERARTPEVLLFSAGDNRTGNPYVDAAETPGLPMIKLMNKLGFNLSTLGNHEFDSGLDVLRDCIDAANFPFVCANVITAKSPRLPMLPYIIMERKGVRIGVIGLVQTGANGLPDAHPDHLGGFRFENPVTVARNYAFLREKCDILILLTHLGFEDDIKLAKVFPEADAIIGGHTHTRIEKGYEVNGVVITQTENKVKYITRLTFEVEDGKVLSKKAELVPLRDLNKDADMEAAVKTVKNNPFMLRKIADVKAEIKHRESIGCMVTDAMRMTTGADIAVVNIGGVRLYDLPAGPFTVEDSYRIDPFGNKLVMVKVTGRELINFLNNVPASDHHGAPCVSGMRYKAIKPAAELKAMTITEATLEDGTPISPEATYTMVTNTYLMSTVPALPKDPGTVLQADGATCIITFLEGQKTVDYSNVSRVDITIRN